MAEKQEKKFGIRWRITLIIVVLVIISLFFGWNKKETTSIKSEVQVIEPLQASINRINEVFTEDQAFEKVEKIENNTLWIFFTSEPFEDIETITRGQSVNVSKEINGVASVKSFVWWKAQFFCVATKWEINSCSDYR